MNSPFDRFEPARSKSPGWTFMTARTRRKIVTSKRLLPVVTTAATKTTSRSMMVERNRRTHIFFTRNDAVTITTLHRCRAAMQRVTKPSSKSDRVLRSSYERPELVTHSTGCNVAAVCFRLRRMTAKTGVVSTRTRRDRKRNTATSRTMTTTATDSRVLRVIERDAKTAQGWKRLHCSRLNICMTDRADRTGATRELTLMTTRARRVLVLSRQSRLRGVRFAPVT